MKKFLALMLSLCIFTALLTGCGNSEETAADENLLGTWVYGEYDTGWIFNSDSTGTDTFFDLAFTYTVSDGTLTITYDEEVWGSVSYTYEITGDSLVMTRISDDSGEEPDSYTYVREGTQADSGENEDESVSDESGESSESDETESESSAE